MPKSDTWPGGVAVESVSGMDSAESCDSVLSINSGFSDDSLEYLSVEERACLMFLEETIESLDVEQDSGLSNDEPDGLSNGLEGKTAHHIPIYQNNTEVLSAHEDPNKVIGRDHKPSPKYLVPTPLLLASGNAKIISKPMESSHIEVPVACIDVPEGFRSSPNHQEPGRTVSVKAALEVATARRRIGPSRDVEDRPPSFIPEPPVRTSLPSDSKAKDGIHKSLDVKSQPKQQKVSSEVPLEFIPPPSDFMDEPDLSRTYSPPPPPAYDGPPEWIPELPKMEPHVSGGSIKPTEVTKSRSEDPETSKGPLSHNEIENLHKKASVKKASHLTPITIAQHTVADKPMTPSPSSEHVPAPKEYGDPKSPPAVAPKPKKLPSNITFKSHKDSGSTHSLISQSERTQMDPQKIRMEALKKLGLVKNEEVTGPSVSPCQSPKFRAKARQQSPAPVEPVQELSRLSENPVPGDMQLPLHTLKHQEAKTREGSLKQPVRSYEIKSATLERTGPGMVIEPAPQMTNPDRSHVELSPGQLRKTPARTPSVSRLSESPVPGDMQLRLDTLKHQEAKTREGSLKQSVRSYEIKSATLERTGPGMLIEPAPQMTNPERPHVGSSPAQLRKTQPRTPSVGSAKDFGIGHQADDSTKSLHAAAVQPGNDAQKLPRSNGISVMISPHGQNGENRREALKKLGLLRD
ncbi:specifically androgen-regulated gene protein [Pimephales promelas]|uniref:specifically androgen-regulated gene protein n=1 Tax=Pimephales promelas TaxID=90988 RepID=UPI0019557820|nr:specifically androgen-regulated gene protein [Pimephales promelas]KAG1960677.1 specifically androgen-regulated protein [Pimephales promelas]KAG1960678.1 specifically androgen-regulated protein [Pimephales promelas]KAG1960679.1 specifically androgen-regulated protein [Pimephales promelas]KAG1960680.1 specifically androgen-regulated protein [Pimephales promelas]